MTIGTTSILGTEVRRTEDGELLVGQGTYIDNLRPDGLEIAHAVFVRSPIAHARLVSVDTTEAADAPGVLGVFTSAELGTDRLPSFASANKSCDRPALAVDKVRYVGDPVALVVARSRAEAVDAAELVDVDYEPLPAVVDVEDALDPQAPLQFEELGTNVATSKIVGDEDPLAGAAHVVRARMVNQRIATAPIEGHAILVDPTSEPVTCWISSQQPHTARDLLAEIGKLETDQLRVIVPHVGGAFGGKAGATAEHGAVLRAAQRLGHAVRWTETRSETMLSMHGRGQVQYAELGLSEDGRIVGLRLRVFGECGAYAGFAGSFATGPTYLMSNGPYAVPKLRYEGHAVMTNTAPVTAFRGAGRPEATAMLERILDLGAAAVGLAPEEIRRRNLLAPDVFPYKTSTGATYDVGDYQRPLDLALATAGIDELRAEQRLRRERGDVRQLGIGISTYVEITGFGGSEYGGIQLHADGSATVMAGTSSHGQGHATAFSMIVSDRLSIPLDKINYVQSDTALVRTGGGTGGSRSLQLGGSAVLQAAEEVHDRAREVAARLLEADPADVVVNDGGFAVAGVPDATVDWAEVIARAEADGSSLDVDTDVEVAGATFPFGAHVAVVEVDTETGQAHPLRLVAVDDCGRILNPMLVAGQQHGGALQGISQALWEEMVYDAEGNPVTSSFVDYAMPTAADAISFEVGNTETPTPLNQLGAKGIGESATIGSTPAVQSAVIDAVSHLGVRHLDLPCTAQRTWSAIRQARSGTLADPWRTPPEIPEVRSSRTGVAQPENADDGQK